MVEVGWGHNMAGLTAKVARENSVTCYKEWRGRWNKFKTFRYLLLRVVRVMMQAVGGA